MIGSVPSRLRLAAVIMRRPRGNLVVGLLLALAFATLVTPIVLAESWLVDATVVAGEPAPATVRLRAFDGFDDGLVAGRGGAVVIARGQVATIEQAELAAAAQRTAPRGLAGFAAYFAVLFVLAAGVTHHLRRSNRGRLLRVQLVLLGTVAAGAALTKGLLLGWPLSVLAVPVALGAVVPTLVFDRTVGLAGGVLAAVVMSLLVPFDVGVSTVLVVQAVAAAIVIPERARPRWTTALAAGAMALAGAVLTYAAFSYLSLGVVPTAELADPASSSWLAAAVGGAMAAILAVPLVALFQLACGEITQAKLVALEDLSHPLLKQIADQAPGTWQHSLAMANMAEIAANTIGASGRLVRVGAYFHDLGKSLQASYFIENLAAGQPSPHDRLAPEVSCDAIFAHVTEGIALARRQKLPERIIDFMHMHHGDGVLEYFWAKCQEQGNPRLLTIDDFRYPGVPPQSRETAILAICDAVEAASRTLKRPDERSIENLVQRIVYGKLHLGQLDESGLSMGDLRRINNSLRETIKHAHHGRIEYPWQREAAALAEQPTGPTVAGFAPTATQRLMQEPRLDSLDAPRPLQWEDTGRPRPATADATGPAPATAADVGAAATVPMATPVAPLMVAEQPRPNPEPSFDPTRDTIAMRPPVAAPVLPIPAPRPSGVEEIVYLTPAMAAPLLATEPMAAVQPPSVTGPMPVVTPSASGSMPAIAAVPMYAASTGPIPMTPSTTATLAGLVVGNRPLGPMPVTLTGAMGPLRPPAVVADAAAPPSDDGPAAADEPPARSSWASTLSARLDTMLEASDDDAFAAEPTKKTLLPPPPPPPPPRRRTHEVEVDDVEATIELSPHARAEASGRIVGPPPATRPARAPSHSVDTGFDGDEGPTVVRKPASSGLPPRARKPE